MKSKEWHLGNVQKRMIKPFLFWLAYCLLLGLFMGRVFTKMI